MSKPKAKEAILGIRKILHNFPAGPALLSALVKPPKKPRPLTPNQKLQVEVRDLKNMLADVKHILDGTKIVVDPDELNY